MARYPFADIETSWQARWQEAGLFLAEPVAGQRKWFVMELPPFANGRLHLGHVRNYTLADASARFRRLAGFNVLYTSGFDAFGLPNDNAAREEGCHPEDLAQRCIRDMSEQFVRLGLGHDTRRLNSYHDPRFYRWIQWVFLKLLEHGQMVRRESKVNWCPSCETTVEEGLVEAEGECWRCRTTLEGRFMKQWFVLETRFADSLLADLEQLDGWPAGVKDIQRRFIGRKEGVEARFRVADFADLDIVVFTETPEILPGVGFLGVGPRHAMVERLRSAECLDAAREERLAELGRDFRSDGGSREERRQKFLQVDAVPLGIEAIDPLSGRRVPVVAINTVDRWSATAAALGVPSHQRLDQRLAGELGLVGRTVLRRPDADTTSAEAFEWQDDWIVDDGEAPWSGVTVGEARSHIAAALAASERGGEAVELRLEPWHWSRQRYWGTPIPIVYCDECGTVPLPEDELPLLLPLDVDWQSPGNPLARHQPFVDTTCPRCGGAARRDTDTLEAYSSPWWYLWICRGLDDDSPFTSADKRYWMPVDLMVGGQEQSTTCFFHLRSVARALVEMGVDEWREPVAGLLAIGMVKSDGEKMSKSKGNAEEPDRLIEQYGADALRLAILMAAAPDRDFNWHEDLLRRASRFLGEVWKFVTSRQEALRFEALAGLEIDTGSPMRRRLHGWLAAAIGKTTTSMMRHNFHLAAKNVMFLFDRLGQFDKQISKGERQPDGKDSEAMTIAVRGLLLMMTPLTPHLSEELWQRCGGAGMIAVAPWPQEVRD